MTVDREDIDELYRPLPRTEEDDKPRPRQVRRLVSGAPALARVAKARALLAATRAPVDPFAA